MLLVSEAFELQAEFELARLGATSARLVVIPHPFGSLRHDEVVAVAEGAVDRVVAALTSSQPPAVRDLGR
ncbi:MAG: hypothetical protein KY469_14345 [Actinobacteria bacterium]|nr:hypothetical protein [Actinomycetota bacterium]